MRTLLHFEDAVPIQNGLKQGVLSSVLFNFALEYAISKVQANQKELVLNGTCQHLVYADDIKCDWRKHKHNDEKTEALIIDASTEVVI
jgi:hypothetical protein